MRNMRKIIWGDLRRLTSSIVAIVMLVGVCVVPCLFAWFNILSNWDPFEPEATGRIPVAVVNEDQGAEMLGLNINVGEKITSAMAANDTIGWVLTKDEDTPMDRETALEGTKQGEYYAAIIIPEDFSSDVMSISGGELRHPSLEYYENGKKNAIAPKITDKARTVLQEMVNETFLGTVGQYLSEAAEAADGAGLEPQQVLGDLSGDMTELSGKIDDALVLVEAAAGISDAADELLEASGGLTDSSQATLSAAEELLQAGEEALPDPSQTSSATDAIKKQARVLEKSLASLDEDLTAASGDLKTFNSFVKEDLAAKSKLVSKMKTASDKAAKELNKLGFTGLGGKFTRLSDRLDKIGTKLKNLEAADSAAWPEVQKSLQGLISDVEAAQKKAGQIGDETSDALDQKIDQAISDAAEAISEVSGALGGMYGNLDSLEDSLSKAQKSLGKLDGGLENTRKLLSSISGGFDDFAELFASFADSDMLEDVNHLLENDGEVIAEHLAAPIRMETKDVCPISSFGSVMAAFYTSLAQWVGALLAAVMISVQVRRRKGQPQLRLHERFFGRYRVFLIIGLLQALLISLGDLLYVGIQCVHPVLFVLAACVNGIAFTLIVYSLVFAMESVGLAVTVIAMILQVAGAGGIFPVQMLPAVFQKMYPFMPLHYAMDAMRECIGGMYGSTYPRYLGILVLMAAVVAAAGMLLYRPMRGLIEKVEESKAETDIMG